MTETAVRLAHGLARSDSAGQAMSLLVAAPVLSPADLMEVVRRPEKYGIPAEEAQRLRKIEGWLAKVLQALTGDLDPTVPADVYGLLAMTSRQQGKREQAKRFYQYSFENAKSDAEKAAALSGTAILEMQQGNLDRARTIFRQAQGICERGGVSGRTLAHILSNLGGVEMDALDWTTAGELFEKARMIGLHERFPDVYALARMNQAELARRQGDAAGASRSLDDIRWIEGSGSPQERDYQALRRQIAEDRTEEQPDPDSQTIEALEQRLLSAGMRVSGVDDVERATVQKALGSKYFARREGRRIENVQAAVSYWEAALAFLEKGKVAGKAVREIGSEDSMKAAAAGLHGDLGLAYNEWYSLDHTTVSASKAREHFEAALKILPERPDFAEYRRALLNNLANAMAWDARTSMTWVIAGQPDRASLRRSLDVQAQLLQELDQDRVGRCQVLINLCQTYGELSEADPDAARDAYYPAAWDCIMAAEKTLTAMEHPEPELVLGVVVKKAQTAADMGRPRAELVELQERLDGLLRNENLAAIKPAVWSTGFRESARLARLMDQKARSYRRLLVAMRMLRLRIASVPVALDAAIADLNRTNADLVASMTDWGQLDRAVYFAGTPPPERTHVYARGRRWRAAAGSCAILFQLISKTRFSAFVITPIGIQVRELPIDPLDLIRAGAQFLTAKIESEQSEDTPASSAKWLSAIAWVSGFIGKKLIGPLEDLLPEGGRLAVIPESPMMRLLPLHLAALAGGKLLLDRFDVMYCSRLCFEDSQSASVEKPQPGEVFIASYSPKAARLPFAALEVQAVAESYPFGTQGEGGESATPEAVLAGLQEARLAHLCSHGNFDWESPLDSKLIFAGRGLTLREIQLSLAQSPCDLIVLSACEAGARGTSAGERADFGSILLRAGCGVVIAADWRVDDLSTMVLMGLLHAALAHGTGSAEALAAAQRKIQTETGGAMAARAVGWLRKCASELTAEEQAYVTKKLDALTERAEAAVFAHAVYWGSFSVNVDSFRLERGRPPNRAVHSAVT